MLRLLSATLLATVWLAQPSLCEFVVDGSTSAWGRIDPIVTPGEVAPHVHMVVGPSNFGKNMFDPNDARCSSMSVGDDKSAYWAPTLYFRHKNNTFSAMLRENVRIYYRFGDEPQYITEFPQGFRMIGGSAKKRGDPYGIFGLELGCSGESQPSLSLPNTTNHPNGCTLYKLGKWMPSCGNGKPTSENNQDHVVYPTYAGKIINDRGVCPPTHPIRYPTLFVEFFFKMDRSLDQIWRQKGDDDECQIMLSNGDCIGDTFHVDFMNGWKKGVLQSAIRQDTECKLSPESGSDELPRCPTFSRSYQGGDDGKDLRRRECKSENQIPDEDIGFGPTTIPKLPGCNPLWKADMPEKPTGNCDADPGWVTPEIVYSNGYKPDLIPVARWKGINMTNLSTNYNAIGGEFYDLKVEKPRWLANIYAKVYNIDTLRFKKYVRRD